MLGWPARAVFPIHHASSAAYLRFPTSRFDDARESAGVRKDLFQFRDFRAKVATETGEDAGIKSAQAILGIA
jgi:hypothetical protein